MKSLGVEADIPEEVAIWDKPVMVLVMFSVLVVFLLLLPMFLFLLSFFFPFFVGISLMERRELTERLSKTNVSESIQDSP